MTSERNPLSVEIGDRLRAQRHGLGLSLSQLSARTEPPLSKSRISNYEQGLRRLGLEEADTLSRALGTVTAAQLLGLEKWEPLTARELELLERFRATDDRGRAMVLALARTEGQAA
jgi:transcriptional regulator with XRE-family HTH domain